MSEEENCDKEFYKASPSPINTKKEKSLKSKENRTTKHFLKNYKFLKTSDEKPPNFKSKNPSMHLLPDIIKIKDKEESKKLFG